jgi:hypothetical protein
MATPKFGRQTRGHDPGIPHMSALLAGKKLKPPPAAKDYTKGMPENLGTMLNERLNICACAAYYHALQVWTFNAAGRMRTEPNRNVQDLYALACGYDPRTHAEPGPIAKEQHVLHYLLREGAPVGRNGARRRKIAAYVEIDPRHIEDVKRAIVDCGVVYIGFHVPDYLAPPPPPVWDVQTGRARIIGGHAVILAGYNAKGARVISCGEYYTMTWAFFVKYVEEVYALADPDWLTHTGATPGGLSLAELKAQMKALEA